MSTEITAIENKANDAKKSIEKLSESIKNLDNMAKSIGKIDFDFSSFSKGYESIKNMGSTLDNIAKGFNTIKNVGFENVMSKMADKGSTLANVYTVLNNALLSNTNVINLQTIATNICTAATMAFNVALEFLKANPLVAVVGAIGLVVGALSLFSDSAKKAKIDTDLIAEAQAKKRKELEETTKAIKNQTSSMIESAKEQEAQASAVRGLVESLRGLTDKEGSFDNSNLEKVKYYIEEINSQMPGTVKLTEEGKVQWMDTEKAIEANIKQLERKAKVEAYYDGYVESLKNESKLRSELTLAQNNYNTELENQSKIKEKYNEIIEKSKNGTATYEDLAMLETYNEQMQQSNERLNEYSSTLDKAKSAYEANKQGADLYNLAVQGLDGSMSASAQLMAEEMLEIGEKGTSTWSSLAAAREDCKTRMLTAANEEKEEIKLANEIINAETVNKAMVFGDSYEKMIANLKEKGAVLSEEEEKQLKNSYEMWSMSTEQINNAQQAGLDTLTLMKNVAMSNMNDDNKRKLAENVKMFAAAGNAEGLQLCQQLVEGLANNENKVSAETEGLMNKMDTIVKDNKLEAKITSKADKASVEKSVSIVKKAMNGIGSVFVGIKSLFGFADGGFVDTGELFIAREAGPELVGRINGKTAVANNDQIVSGISSGVYNAMVSAMSRSHQANTTVTAIFQVDGKQVAKQVINAHNREVMQTGRSPLLI